MTTLLDQDRPLLLDGGTGRELLKRRVPILNAIWSATALYLAPEIVRQVHLDFITAGADIITTNTYGLAERRLASVNMAERFDELHLAACRLAREAREAGGRTVAIAGSLPPLWGSYRPDLVAPHAELVGHYRRQVELLAPHVDLFICETMSSAAEALGCATAAVESGKPVWVAWTLDEDHSGRLRSGETVKEAAAAIAHLPVAGYLANCCPPESITAAMPALLAIGKGRVGGYANTFRPVPEDWKAYDTNKLDPADWERYEGAALPLRGDLDPAAYADHAVRWRSQGAHIIGGCCGVGPEHIARLRLLMDAAA